MGRRSKRYRLSRWQRHKHLVSGTHACCGIADATAIAGVSAIAGMGRAISAIGAMIRPLTSILPLSIQGVSLSMCWLAISTLLSTPNWYRLRWSLKTLTWRSLSKAQPCNCRVVSCRRAMCVTSLFPGRRLSNTGHTSSSKMRWLLTTTGKISLMIPCWSTSLLSIPWMFR